MLLQKALKYCQVFALFNFIRQIVECWLCSLCVWQSELSCIVVVDVVSSGDFNINVQLCLEDCVGAKDV